MLKNWFTLGVSFFLTYYSENLHLFKINNTSCLNKKTLAVARVLLLLIKVFYFFINFVVCDLPEASKNCNT